MLIVSFAKARAHARAHGFSTGRSSSSAGSVKPYDAQKALARLGMYTKALTVAPGTGWPAPSSKRTSGVDGSSARGCPTAPGAVGTKVSPAPAASAGVDLPDVLEAIMVPVQTLVGALLLWAVLCQLCSRLREVRARSI